MSNKRAKEPEAKKASRARRRQERLKKQFHQNQLSVAADIQALLLPRRIPRIEGYEMTAFYQPCEQLGGDYYDFIEMDEGHLGMLVADVSGHGFPGALIMSQVRTMMRAEALHSLSPKEVLMRVNRLLYGEIPRGMFVTMLYGVLEIPRSTLRIACAGHNPLCIWRSSGNHEEVKPAGMALGVDAGSRFEAHLDEVQVKLEPKDGALFYTDGVTEMMDGKNRLFGTDRLWSVYAECAESRCDEFIARLNTSLEEFRGRARQHDDVTVLALRRLAEAPAGGRSYSYVDGDKFVRCPVCTTVNRREQLRCRSCGGRLDPKDAGKPAAVGGPAPGLAQCPSCGRIFAREAISKGCPSCMRRICARCGTNTAVVGDYCESCAAPAGSEAGRSPSA